MEGLQAIVETGTVRQQESIQQCTPTRKGSKPLLEKISRVPGARYDTTCILVYYWWWSW